MHIYSLCFAALIVQLQLASYPDYCCMHRVCAAVVEVRLQPARSFRPTEHIQPGTLMSDSILVTYWATFWPYTAICYLLAVVLQLHWLLQHAHTARYRLQGV
jgi:hypothetical protein